MLLFPLGFLGSILALGSAIAFAGNRAFASRPLVKSDPVYPTYLSLLLGVPVVAAGMILVGQESALITASFLVLIVFVIVGILHFAIGRQISYHAEKNIGANQAAPLISTQIVYAVIFSIIFLGESLNYGIAIGSILILLGVFLLEIRASAQKRGGNLKKGYIAALVTSFIFGISPLLIKYGLELFNYYAAATFLAYCAGLIFFMLTRNPFPVLAGIRKLPKYAIISYCVSGILAAAGQLLRFGALSIAPVVIVVPILASHPIFTALMTRKLSKDYEVFRTRTIFAIVTVVAGTIIVSLSSTAIP